VIGKYFNFLSKECVLTFLEGFDYAVRCTVVDRSKNGQRAHLSSSAVQMQTTLYGDHCARQAGIQRDKILEAKGRTEKGLCIWENQDLETCGMDAYGIDTRAEIAASKPAARRQFKLWKDP